MKSKLFAAVEQQKQALCHLADSIFDHPELGHEEHFAQEQVADYLKANGFQVTLGAGNVETALRAEYQSLEGGLTIGFCAEYDALPLGHACSHHLQSAFACGAAVALKNVLGGEIPFRIVVYTTPDEEGNINPGKNEMIEGGCFRELDIALLAHGGTETTIDETSLALQQIHFKYCGISTHASAQPEAGRPAWDACQIAIHGLSYLRGHLPQGANLNWAICGFDGPNGTDPNAVSKGKISVSALRVRELKSAMERVYNVLDGAAMMTETSVEYDRDTSIYLPKLRLPSMTECFYKNAEEAGALRIEPPRTRKIVTDTGSLSQVVPTCGVRIGFAPKGTSAHSKEWLQAGKSDAAHDAVVTGGKVLAGMAIDFINNEELRCRVKNEWEDAMERRE